jgi:hypothetical protein
MNKERALKMLQEIQVFMEKAGISAIHVYPHQINIEEHW